MLPPPAAIVTVLADPGGFVARFGQRVEQYLKRGTRVRIMGPCYSACTLVTRLGDRVCVGPGAAFGFHQAFLARDPRHPTDADVFNRDEGTTRAVWTWYPGPVRAWIDARGGLTADIIVLRGAELRTMFPACR